MSHTYTVTATDLSCKYSFIEIKVEKVNYFFAMANYKILALAFRDVKITSDYTGEVEKMQYTSEKSFVPEISIEQAIGMLKTLQANWEER